MERHRDGTGSGQIQLRRTGDVRPTRGGIDSKRRRNRLCIGGADRREVSGRAGVIPKRRVIGIDRTAGNWVAG